MKIRPILFSTPMVQAILDKRKTQTRRIIKPQPIEATYGKMMYGELELTMNSLKNHSKYQIGDIIWVRETWQYSDDLEHPYLYKQKELEELTPAFFKLMTWKPSIFMPKEVCRTFLVCTDVRVERLNDISEKDAIAEGIIEYAYGYWKNYTSLFSGGRPKTNIDFKSPCDSFKTLWQSINGKGSWEANPWVWAYDFKQTERPSNFLKDE
jgi:hypothetical protein